MKGPFHIAVCILGGLLSLAVVLAFGFRRGDSLRFDDAYLTTVVPRGSSVEISGEILHSGASVSRVIVSHEGDRAFVSVLLVPVRDGMVGATGHFSAIVPNVGLREIYLGDPFGTVTIATLYGVPLRLPITAKHGNTGRIWPTPPFPVTPRSP